MLPEPPKSRPGTCIISLVGSRAYGIASETSDIDMKGVYVPPLEALFGYLENPGTVNEEWFFSGIKTESTLYPLQKFVAQCVGGSAESLDVLFSPHAQLLLPLGQELYHLRDKFLSGKVRHSFLGFAHSQLAKLRRDPANGHAGKQAAQALRLFNQAEEILLEGTLHVSRTPRDAEELLRLRANWRPEMFPDFEKRLKDQEERIDGIYRSGRMVVPKEPPRKELDDALVGMLKRHFSIP